MRVRLLGVRFAAVEGAVNDFCFYVSSVILGLSASCRGYDDVEIQTVV